MKKPSIARKFSVGDAFVPERAFLNALVSAGQDAKNPEDGTPEHFADSLSYVDVLVKNDSAQDYGRYDVVGLGDALIIVANDINEFLRIPAFHSDIPVSPSDIGNWAVCLETIPVGKFGMARAAGVVFVGITAGSSDPVQAFAEISSGDVKLVFATDGSAKVLWAEPTGTDRWAIVRIGGGGGGGSGPIVPACGAKYTITIPTVTSGNTANCTFIAGGGGALYNTGANYPTLSDSETILINKDAIYLVTASVGAQFNTSTKGNISLEIISEPGSSTLIAVGQTTVGFNTNGTQLYYFLTCNDVARMTSGNTIKAYLVNETDGTWAPGAAAAGSITIQEFQLNGSGGSGGSNNVRATMLASDVTNSTATFANLDDLSVAVDAGLKYRGRIDIWCENSVAAEGIKFDFNGGDATMTDFRSAAGIFATGSASYTQGTSLGAALSDVVNWTLLTGAVNIILTFEMTCNAAGTLIPRVAENSHSSGTVTVRKGSNLEITKIG